MISNIEQRNDLIEASNALILSSTSLEKRIAAMDEEQRRARTERRAAIDALVAQLLPDLRLSTFDTLAAVAPRFADAEVRFLMQRRWYFLFFFKRKGHDVTLTTLRTRMAFAAGKGLLPQIADQVAEWDKSIDTLQAQRGELAVTQRNVDAALNLLRAALGNTIRLPEQAKKDVQTIVQRARQAKFAAQASQTTARPHQYTTQRNTSEEVAYTGNPITWSTVDPWVSFADDMAQSLSVVAFEAMRQTHQADPMNDNGGIGTGSVRDDGIDFADPPANAAGSDIDFGDAPVAASGSDIDFGDAPASTGGSAIATDDRFGAFS